MAGHKKLLEKAGYTPSRAHPSSLPCIQFARISLGYFCENSFVACRSLGQAPEDKFPERFTSDDA
jgi:hypothetical protein